MLVGRETELALIGEFLTRAAVDGGALVLAGEPGIGKTALLQAAAQHAARTGTRVLRSAGSGFDSSVSFAGLTQVVMPLMACTGNLTAAQRRALQVVLGLSDGPAPQQTTICQAVLGLLQSAAASEPVLMIVDDLQWLDRYSAGVLGFVAHRWAGSRIGVLAASRSAVPGQLGPAGVPHHGLAPLDSAASEALLRSRYPGLPRGVRRRLLEEAQGNPLALLELPSALNGRQTATQRELPSVLPLSERLQAVFAARITGLPQATRDLLLLAALDGTGDLYALRAAAATPVFDDLAAAERERLVRVDEDRHALMFHHPLTRSAVVELSTAAQRHRAHRALAQARADSPQLRARHLAASADRPEEDIAGALEQCARLMLRRGDVAGAIAALVKAADLSPVPGDRSRRYAEAAYIGSNLGWQLSAAPDLLDQARHGQLDPAGALHAAAAAGRVMMNAGHDVDSVHRLVVAAIEAHAGSYDVSNGGLVAAVAALSTFCLLGGRPELWPPCQAALGRLSPAVPHGLHLQASTLFDPVRTAPPVLKDLDASIAALHGETDPEELAWIAGAAVYADRLAGCRDALRRLIRAEKDGSAVFWAVFARLLLCIDAFGSGRWDEAEQTVTEALGICEAAGENVYAQGFRYHGALVAAARGDAGAVRSLTGELIAWATPRGARLLCVFAWHARALEALSRADFEQAYQNAAAVSPPGTFPAYEATALWACFDLVEAAVRTNRRRAARAHVAAMLEADLAAFSPRLALVTYGSAALAADDASAGALFDRALAVPGAERWPFEYARVQLAHGQYLRRAHASHEAQSPLRSALATFQSLGARPWAARAAGQLRAAGAPSDRGERGSATALTVQEKQVASLAATGLTNKQIGEQLHLSPRTVSTHLYRLFPKLGITTRAALRDALTEMPGRHE